MSGRVLFIVESPNKAKKIQGYFPQFKVMATMGHFRDLPLHDLGVELPDHKPQYVDSPDKAAIIKRMRSEAKAADHIYVATDLDREGEAIAAHVVNTLGSVNKSKIARVTYNEISEAAIKNAIASKRQVNWALVRAQEARRVLDRYVGYLVTPALTDKFNATSSIKERLKLSAGRVQSVVVKLVVERQKAIDTFVSVDHYGVTATMVKTGIEFKAHWKPALPKGELILDKRVAQEVVNKTHTLKIIQSITTPRKNNAPAPLITTSFVRLVGGSLGLTTKQAMACAQRLFEAGLITYHRTDSPFMSPEFVSDIRDFATRNKLPVPATAKVVKGSANAQEAHECLRVTDINLMNARLAGIDDEHQRAVYSLVWLATLESQLADGVDETTVVLFENSSGDQFFSRAHAKVQLGWRAAAKQFGIASADQNQESDDKELQSQLPKLNAGDSLTPTSVDLVSQKTEAPKSFTEVSLISKLESMGIGRPSTYASIIENIIDKHYVMREGKNKKITPAVTGMLIVEHMDNEFSFMSYEYTANMEKSLDLIASGSAKYIDVVQAAYASLQAELKKFTSGLVKVNSNNKSQNLPTPNIEQCAGDQCSLCEKGTLKSSTFASGKNAGRSFIGCTQFPVCRFFQWAH